MEKPPRTFLKQLRSITLCGKPGDVFLLALEHFHGDQTPGLIMGAIMVDWAFELLGIDSDPKAVVENRSFLPDAVQLLTPCTVGNGRLITLDWNKMALSLFDRRRMAGYRVWLDLKKTRSSPTLYAWQMRLTLPPGITSDHVIMDILQAGRKVLSYRAVPITRAFNLPLENTMGVCPQCDEAYPVRQGDRCRACQGESYYELCTAAGPSTPDCSCHI